MLIILNSMKLEFQYSQHSLPGNSRRQKIVAHITIKLQHFTMLISQNT
jgi:hypothetical protein